MQCGRFNSLFGIGRQFLQRKAGSKSADGLIPGCRNLSYKTIAVTTPSPNVFHVELNRPDKRNAFDETLWLEIGKCFNDLEADSSCRAIILSGAGRMFTSGIDFGGLGNMMQIIAGDEDIARKSKKVYNIIRTYQNSYSALEKCHKPIIAAIHDGCIGAGVDLIAGTDIRYCSADAWFQIKEVDVGLAADVGTLQRLPRIIGSQSLVCELAYSARKMFSDEALAQGLVSRVFPDKAKLIEGALEMGATIASKSPVAIQGTKRNLIYSRDHTVEEGLEYEALWNMTMLQSEDLVSSASAIMGSGKATFKDY